MLTHCRQDGEITVEYRPLEDTVDPSNMLCAGKVCFSNKKQSFVSLRAECGTATAAAVGCRLQSTVCAGRFLQHQWPLCFAFDQDSSSVMEWKQCSGGRSQQLLETQQSYETEWDMVNTVSFKKRPCGNTEGELSPVTSLHHLSFR